MVQLDVFENAMFGCQINKQNSMFFYRRLSIQLFMVLIAGLHSLLLISFSLWLGSFVIRPAFKVTLPLNLDAGSQNLFYFP